VVEGDGGEVRVGEVNDGEEVAVEGVSEGAESGGLAGADVAGDESGKALLEGEGEAALDLLVAAGGEEVGAGDRLGEGRGSEAIEIIQSSHGKGTPFGWDRAVRSE
jgi:hypothetical protein